MNISTASRSTKFLFFTLTAIVWGLFGYAIWQSTAHVVDASLKLGLTGTAAYTSFLLVDVFAIVGKIGMLPRWNAEARKAAKILLIIGLTLSLAANVYAGHNMGERAQGIIIVIAMAALENFMGKLMGGVAAKAEEAPKAGKKCDEGCECGKHIRKTIPAPKTSKCLPGCTCGKHNRAKKAVTTAP